MTDDKDAEIRELKARLERVEGRSERRPSGFGGGFFGCFGVLAAFIVVGAAFLALGMCAPPEDGQVATPDANSTTFDAANAENAAHCVNGLTEAARVGPANAEQTALVVPWRITGRTTADGYTQLTCAAQEAGQPATVVVQVVCADTSRASCTNMLSYFR